MAKVDKYIAEISEEASKGEGAEKYAVLAARFLSAAGAFRAIETFEQSHAGERVESDKRLWNFLVTNKEHASGIMRSSFAEIVAAYQVGKNPIVLQDKYIGRIATAFRDAGHLIQDASFRKIGADKVALCLEAFAVPYYEQSTSDLKTKIESTFEQILNKPKKDIKSASAESASGAAIQGNPKRYFNKISTGYQRNNEHAKLARAFLIAVNTKSIVDNALLKKTERSNGFFVEKLEQRRNTAETNLVIAFKHFARLLTGENVEDLPKDDYLHPIVLSLSAITEEFPQGLFAAHALETEISAQNIFDFGGKFFIGYHHDDKARAVSKTTRALADSLNAKVEKLSERRPDSRRKQPPFHRREEAAPPPSRAEQRRASMDQVMNFGYVERVARDEQVDWIKEYQRTHAGALPDFGNE